MVTIRVSQITDVVTRLCQEANYRLTDDVFAALEAAVDKEESEAGREILLRLVENANIAREHSEPICQDTGVAVVFVELGRDCRLDGDLYEAIDEGVRRGYRDGYLRKSMVRSPIDRVNTGDNTPAVVHLRLVEGDRMKITVAPKGGGSENMSAIGMLKPADGRAGVIQFIRDQVDRAGSNPCPPLVVGVGLGGTMEQAALLAKEALLRPIGSWHPDPGVADLERELLGVINDLGIGPQGLGGRITALWVSVNSFPCHIASLPVAVNINCHAARHATAELGGASDVGD